MIIAADGAFELFLCIFVFDLCCKASTCGIIIHCVVDYYLTLKLLVLLI